MQHGELEEELSIQRESARSSKTVLVQRALEEPISSLRLRKPVTVPLGTTVADAIRTMAGNGTGCVLVMGAGGLIGIFTERDVLIKVAAGGLDARLTPVEQVMTARPETLRAEDSIVFALNKMSVGGFRHVPIVDEPGKPVGVLSVKDVVHWLVDQFASAVLNIPPEPGRGVSGLAEGG